MAAHFLSDNLVKLPRFTVPELITLMLQLEAEASRALQTWNQSGRQVPEFVGKSLALITQTRKSLEEAQQKTVSPETLVLQRRGDRQMDDAWKAFESFFKAWSLLDDSQTPGQAEAQRIYDMVIGDGMSFITLPFELEWQETKKRIEIVEKQNLIPTIEALGGGRFWRQLKKAFSEYGQALKMDEPRPEVPALRSLWENAYGAVRHYFAKVVALEDPEEPETQNLVRRLLKPIIEWQQKAATSSASIRLPTNPRLQILAKDPSELENEATAKTLKMKIIEE